MSSASLRLAWFSPLPPQRTGIADYSRDLLPFVAELADVTLFADDPGGVTAVLRERFEIRPSSDYPAVLNRFDLPVYHLGNSRFHKNIYEMFSRYPGIAVLHDYVLHHFLADAAGWGEAARYQRELSYNGHAGAVHDLALPPLNGRVLDLALGLIVHSQFAAQKAQKRNPELPIAHIPQPMPPQTGQSRRADLPFPPDAVIFASVGLMAAAKQIDLTLRAFARLARQNSRVYYLLVGDALPEVQPEALVAELQLEDRVYYAGYAADLPDFVDWVTTADVIVNLRYPTTGETSASALRGMAAGKPVLVFKHGWYAEIPGDTCVQLPVMDEAALLREMSRLADSAVLRAALGERARRYIETKCRPQHAAVAYTAFAARLLDLYGGF